MSRFPPPPGEPRTGHPTITFRLPPAVYAAAKARALADGVVIGELCRRALASHLGAQSGEVRT